MKKNKTAHIVSHTHWDREWRYPIWETRLLLTDFMDELLENFKKGRYPHFLMDGQISPILDYLEIKPEKKEEIKKLIEEGELSVGPWYTLPDEYPVEGEALVRNLLKGIKKSLEFGGVFRYGYTSFGWGQTAQLPQIYKGFGINTAMIGKRVDKKRAPHCEFIWEGPDGSRLLTTRFGEKGRQNFYFSVHLLSVFAMDHDTMDWKYHWKKGGVLFHRADGKRMEQDHYQLEAPKTLYTGLITKEILDKTWETTNESLLENDRLMMNGCDYSASQPLMPLILKHINEIDEDSERRWVHTSMKAYAERLETAIDREKLPVVRGELRDAPVGWLTGNALTTRVRLKIKNKKAQNLLIGTAEPLHSLSRLLGTECPVNFIHKAWDYLLKAHPHDTINGVTQDKTARDAEYRLDQVLDIAQTVTDRSLQNIIKSIDLKNFNDDDVLLVVYNPLPFEREEVVEAYLTIPNDLKKDIHWPDDMGFVHIYDTDGHPLPTQWEGAEEVSYCVAELHGRILPLYGQRHRLFFHTGKIPPMGYRVYRAARGEEIRPSGTSWSDNQARTGNLLKNPYTLANEYFQVTMNPNGSFNCLDLENNREYKNLNYYEDRGEHGTYWINWRPMYQKTFNSLGSRARVWVEEQGPLRGVLVSEIEMVLPQKGRKAEQRRGDNELPLRIRTYVSLNKGEKKINVKVELENSHEDHYLRALFPTGISGAKGVESGGHFTVDSRPLKPQGPTEESYWPDMATLPQNKFADISDSRKGFAIVHDCLTEYEVLDDDDKTLAVSLLRSVKNWIVTGHVGSDFPSQKGGQCLGGHVYSYSLIPHEGDWKEGGIFPEAEKINHPLIPVETNKHEGVLPGSSYSFMEITNPQIRFSAWKTAENNGSHIIRLYNPSGETETGHLMFFKPVKQAWTVNLNEDRLEDKVSLSEGKLSLSLGPQKIATYEIEFD